LTSPHNLQENVSKERINIELRLPEIMFWNYEKALVAVLDTAEELALKIAYQVFYNCGSLYLSGSLNTLSVGLY